MIRQIVRGGAMTRLASLALALLAVGCGGTPDRAGSQDMATAAAGDMTLPAGDSAQPAGDMAGSLHPDFAAMADLSLFPPDQSVSVDLARGEGGCAPTAEVCNGLDDDCDGVADNGCPTGIGMTNTTAMSMQFGNGNGGNAFADLCPLGQALVGVRGNYGGNIDQLGGICATPTVAEDKGAIPYSYSVHTAAGAMLPIHGMNQTMPYTAQCPANLIAVGASGQAGPGGVSKVHLTCAPFAITGKPGAWTLTAGMTTVVAVDGTTVYAAYSYSAAGVDFLDGVAGRSGAWIDAIAFTERKPQIVVR